MNEPLKKKKIYTFTGTAYDEDVSNARWKASLSIQHPIPLIGMELISIDYTTEKHGFLLC